MIGTVNLHVKPEEIIDAVKSMKEEDREAFVEDLLASVSPEYLESIKEARSDYQAKRVKTHEDVFGK